MYLSNKYQLLKAQLSSIFLAMLLLLIAPLSSLVFNWQWQLNMDFSGLKFLYFITETGGMPFAVLSTFILLGCFSINFVHSHKKEFAYLSAKIKRKQVMILIIMCSSVIFSGQIVKTILKESVERPRPYVAALLAAKNLSAVEFYHQTDAQKAAQIGTMVDDFEKMQSQVFPKWLLKHWQKNVVEFSFPSGHTLFVACWEILAFVIFSKYKSRLFLGLITIWANLVMISRMALGMHYASDLIAGIVMSGFFVIIATLLFFPHLQDAEKITFFE